ncbi:hypothetical protein SNEBB_005115 [Seison nebaliae]|nr:hypothetical protein SNEBB_005115 [Seison nebaliae]
MVLISVGVCNKQGKTLFSRQFVKMDRGRIEGLLAAFPKLMVSGKQHTFVETESVRYVYQSIDQLYMLLITTKESNILDDLETLRMFVRVLPEYSKTQDESEVMKNSFDLLFAFDEIVALGYRESVNIAQIRSYTDMNSQEEKMHNQMRVAQEKEQKEIMRRKAKEFAKARALTSSNQLPTNSSSINNGLMRNLKQSVAISEEKSKIDKLLETKQTSNQSVNKNTLKLSRSQKADSFIKDLKTDVFSSDFGSQRPSAKTASTSSKEISSTPMEIPDLPEIHKQEIHFVKNETINATFDHNGGVKLFEVVGTLQLQLQESAPDELTIRINEVDKKQINVILGAPVNKMAYSKRKVIEAKSGKFSKDSEVFLLRWRFSNMDINTIPLNIICWPNNKETSVEYELTADHLELRNIIISIPVTRCVINEIEDETTYEQTKSMLLWRIPFIDSSAPQGTLLFRPTDEKQFDEQQIFPIRCTFNCHNKTFCDINVLDISHSSNGVLVNFSEEVQLSTNNYELVY